MAEKLLVAQALDERDFLYEKLSKAINDATFVLGVKEKDVIYKGKSIEDWEKDIAANYQSITDQIDRYDRICRAITLSNATTTIKFSNGKEMTVAEALALKANIKVTSSRGVRNMIDKTPLRTLLLIKMQRQIESVTEFEERTELDQQRNRDRYIQTQIENQGGNKDVSEQFIKSIDTIIAPFNAKRIDPVKIEEKFKAMDDETKSTAAEIETLIKISNATTYIEF